MGAGAVLTLLLNRLKARNLLTSPVCRRCAGRLEMTMPIVNRVADLHNEITNWRATCMPIRRLM